MGSVMIWGQEQGKIVGKKEKLLFNEFCLIHVVAGEGKLDAVSFPHVLDYGNTPLWAQAQD